MFVGFLFLSTLCLGSCDGFPNPFISTGNQTDSLVNNFKNLIYHITLLFEKNKTPYGGAFQMTSRSEWGAGYLECNIELKTPVPYLIIHHVTGRECHEKATCQQLVKDLQKVHIKKNNLCDVAYNFLIGDDGFVYEGVGWTIEGSHTVGYNNKSLGFAFVGSAEGSSPSDAALATAKSLISFAVYKGYLSSKYIQPLFVQSESCMVSHKKEVIRKECPDIVPRSSWRAQETSCDKLPGPAKYVIIIHTAGQTCNVTEACKVLLRNIQSYHISQMKFCDIAYNFLVGEDGSVFEGVGWNTEGAHTYGYNDIGLGIAFLGLFTDTAPNAAALEVAQDLIQCAVDKGYLIPDYLLVGHRDVVNTISPGQALYNKIKSWPHFKH